MLKLPHHKRYDYLPITTAASTTRGPAASGSPFYFAINIEYFAFGAGQGIDPTGGTAPQTAAQLRVARLRQSRRHLAHVRILRRAQACPPRHC